jgi:hypothetical protein
MRTTDAQPASARPASLPFARICALGALATLVGCGAFASLAPRGQLMTLTPNWARQGDTVVVTVSFPEVPAAILLGSRLTGIDFGAQVQPQRQVVAKDGSIDVTLLVAQGAALGERRAKATLVTSTGETLAGEAAFHVLRPR